MKSILVTMDRALILTLNVKKIQKDTDKKVVHNSRESKVLQPQQKDTQTNNEENQKYYKYMQTIYLSTKIITTIDNHQIYSLQIKHQHIGEATMATSSLAIKHLHFCSSLPNH